MRPPPRVFGAFLFCAPPHVFSSLLFGGRPIVRWFTFTLNLRASSPSILGSCVFAGSIFAGRRVTALHEVARVTIATLSSYSLAAQIPPRSSKNLALDTPSRDSFYSCPDLSTLQISQPSVSASVDALDHDFNTEPSRSPSPENGAPRGAKKRSNRQAVSRKARGVIGKVRAFHRIVAAKMAHPSIKIDTNIQTTKRGLPVDNDAGPDVLDDGQGNPRLESGNTDDVPPFLCQSVSEIHDKFEDLEWMQRTRLAEGMLSNDPAHPWALESDPDVKARNRYINVQAWANCRIHLRVPEGECDFINASPIVLKDSVTQEERRYIATQGPKLGQLWHFWHMVFHESTEVGVIVMLTQTFEAGREKCSQYFPLDLDQASMALSAEESDPFVSDESDEQEDAGIVGKVTLLETTFDPKTRSEIRKLELTIGSESKIVWHFLFAGWADYSKPEGSDRQALLELITLSASKCSTDNPRVVHCSAGVGRTGTFIALDHLLRELESGQLLQVTDSETDPVFETVNQMREQRMMMVYNEMQMQFIYEVLREQTDAKLGKPPVQNHHQSPSSDTDGRSAKVAKLSDQADYLPASKPELEAAVDNVSTPVRSWSGTPDLSDNE
ncbi:protein-tyrosine phosphatase 2 [Penicillium hispanicum]|uniref:protein-tyrosine phosphatase 2 n=1 Tax=Penicillium hispanicum TaxID=1080232 RepID=UPI002540F9F4|nr:protein-tyrosine phosphatase 2 [Penicillium hispanicum]KAJ5594789.1 protein-tyrosine phosphatase 2 [Penicillium hispanicum]